MLGWKRRSLFLTTPFFLPRCIRVEGVEPDHSAKQWLFFAFCALLAFSLAVGARLLELPYWDNPAYKLGDEFLLATHDAYHWIAGAEGFEFGVGHPMSELVRMLAEWTGMSPANLGFWLPPFMGGLLAVGVFLWGWGFGYPYGGVCAGVLASLSPAFCARTLLGFYDTDLVVLLFAVLLGLVPALWLTPWLASVPEVLWATWKEYGPGGKQRRNSASAAVDATESANIGEASAPFFLSRERGLELAANPLVSRWFFSCAEGTRPFCVGLSPAEMQKDMLAWPWVLLLIASGIFGHWMQDWHSLFPYLVRFSALILPVLILVLGPVGGRAILLRGALCHAFPLLLGVPGALAAVVYALALRLLQPGSAAEVQKGGWERYNPLSTKFWRYLLYGNAGQYVLWAAILYLACDQVVLDAMLRSFASYVNRSGDMTSLTTAASDPLIFPSVAQSIIEVQTINLQELLIYTYPIESITLFCVFAFLYRMVVTPAFVWFLPLFLLSFLSVQMGGRMTMFGPPVLMLILCIEGGLLLEVLFFRMLLPFLYKGFARGKPDSWLAATLSPLVNVSSWWGSLVRLAACLVCAVALAWPLITLLPDYTQGPVISREQAEALDFIKKNTPEDSIVWNWWDWGYATHHFSQRVTIADGARHGGPSLYLPAAVYTTADPRFARQLIKYVAARENSPGKVFDGLSATGAQDLMQELGNRSTPLVQAPGKQYIVVSFELLRLGLWVTRYGSWNFVTKEGSGSLMNNLSQALEFNMETGVILPKNGQPVYAGSIDIFDPKGLERQPYNRFGAYHFIFNPQTSEQDALAKRDLGPLERFWQWQRGYFAFTALSNDKMVVDETYYNTMMVQLLLCPKDDPRITPHFKLVFDNVYSRVYEVR